VRQMKTCPKCGGENLGVATVCRLCATALPAVQAPVAQQEAQVPTANSARVASRSDSPASAGALCQACQATIDPDSLFCEQCGYRLTGPAHQMDSRSQMKAAGEAARVVETPAHGSAQASDQQSTLRPAGADVEPFRHPRGARKEPSAKSTTETGPQVPARHSARNMGMSTSVVCDACGSIQPMGGAFCADCGAQLSVGAIARALSVAGSTSKGSLYLITDGGEVGETYKLDRTETVIGRAEGDLTYPHDGFMSGRHARIIARGARYFLADEGSRNGTFIRIDNEVELQPGDTFLIGKQVLRFDTK
jgi:hypothetical protein